jgi:hypothetical protein
MWVTAMDVRSISSCRRIGFFIGCKAPNSMTSASVAESAKAEIIGAGT